LRKALFENRITIEEITQEDVSEDEEEEEE
jgi:hypothetical protein